MKVVGPAAWFMNPGGSHQKGVRTPEPFFPPALVLPADMRVRIKYRKNRQGSGVFFSCPVGSFNKIPKNSKKLMKNVYTRSISGRAEPENQV